MLIVTHDMKMASDVANHVIFLHQGVVEEEGSPSDIFGNTRSNRLRQFLQASDA
jgi:polar amino acid transport system ATP-binding protein